jgi:transcriptional regulator with XRE-family HTH domain
MIINDNILSLINNSPEQIICGISVRVKQRRLEAEFTQQELSHRAGISLPTYRRFERTGEIALKNLTAIALALGMEDDIKNLFATKTYSGIDDLLKTKKNVRKRGKRNRRN